jgi:crotonobetainyl-CoA:carnitine CoA-transferase CaiB-like acyl-CoA transferase
VAELDLNNPVAGRYSTPMLPAVQRHLGIADRTVPRLGAHTAEVLTELGFEAARSAALTDSGIVVAKNYLGDS